MELGWVKIHRQIVNWEWYDEPNTFRLFIHLLLKVNHKPKKYRGVEIKAGQIMTGQELLAKELKLTRTKIRSALNNLKSTNEITIKTSSKGTIIQIVKYVDYQIITNETTTKQPDDNQRVTTNKNVNNVNNEKKNKFLIFWKLYPKKVNKDGCLKKWLKLSDEDIKTIGQTIYKYIAYKPFDDYTHPNPMTYLNQKRWNDEIPVNAKADILNHGNKDKRDAEIEFVRKLKEGIE